MKPALILIRPLDRSTNQRIDIRVADAALADWYGLNGMEWEPALSGRPTMSIELMSPDMDGRVQTGTTRFEIDTRRLRDFAGRDIYWRGAPIILLAEAAILDSGKVPEFVGYCASEKVDRETGKVTIEGKVSTTKLETPLLTAEFDGGGGLDGEPDKRGTLRPAGFGLVYNIEPVWFDSVRNIGQIDGYGNTQIIGWCGEGLSSLGPRTADFPTYAQLAAAIDAKQIPPGGWATSVADGCIGLGAPAAGVITCHAQFGTSRPGEMMKRWLLVHAAIDPAMIDNAAFDALDMIVPRKVHYWTNAQRQVDDLLETMAASCNATPLVTFQGMISVTRAIGGALAGTLDRSGAIEPRVLNWQSADSQAPYWQLKARAARPARVLTYDQVLYDDTIDDKGIFKLDVEYRNGDIVWLRDKSKWLYKYASPAKGKVPGASGSEAYWENLLPATTAADILYDSGDTLESLKPAQKGADKTSENTSKNTMSLGGRLANLVLTDISTNTQNTFDLTGVVGAYKRSLDEFTTMPDGTKVVRQIDQVGIKTQELDLFKKDVTEIDPATGTVKAIAVTNANGVVTAFEQMSGPGGGIIGFMADIFVFFDTNGGNPKQVLFYEDDVWKMSNIEVDTIKAKAIDTPAINDFAIRRHYGTELASNIDLPRTDGQRVRMLSVTVNKQLAESFLRVEMLMRPRPARDYAAYFQIGRTYNGQDTVMDTVWLWLPSAVINNARSLRIPVPFMRSFQGIPAGTHTLWVDVVAYGGGNDQGYMEMGSNFDIEEIKR